MEGNLAACQSAVINWAVHGGYAVQAVRPLGQLMTSTAFTRLFHQMLTAQRVTCAVAAAAAALLYLRHRRHKLPPPQTPQPELTADEAKLWRLLEVIEKEILPKTEVEVAAGNKVFGAAILDDSCGTVVADTNHETICPLYHGEIYTIEQWSLLADKPAASSCIFLATHEPCCLCISAIVWSGFKKCFYLYPYETTRDQGIPHDLNIMFELWRVPRYQQRNKFCSTAGILDLIKALPDSRQRRELQATVARITARYDALATKYHSEKAANPKNTMAFN